MLSNIYKFNNQNVISTDIYQFENFIFTQKSVTLSFLYNSAILRAFWLSNQIIARLFFE